MAPAMDQIGALLGPKAYERQCDRLDSSHNLADHYAAVASDGSKDGKAREAALLFSLAEGQVESEQDEEAMKAAKEALTMFKELKDENGVADILRIMIHVHISNNRRKEAADLASAELEVFKKSGSKSGEAKMLLSLAEANYDCRGSKYREAALKDAHSASSMFHELSDKKMVGISLLALMNIQMKMKADAEAFKSADLAFQLFTELGDKKSQALVLHAHAALKVRGQAFDQGLTMSKQALSLFRELGLKKLEGFEMQCIANWYLMEEKTEDSIAWAEKATDLFRSIKYVKGEMAALETVVQANLASGDPVAAIEEAQSALKRSRKLGDVQGEVAALEMVVLASIARKDYGEALASAEKAVEKIKVLGNDTWQLNMLRTMARLHARLKNPTKAVRIAEEADKLADTIGGDTVKAAALHTLSDVLFEKGDWDKSLSVALLEKELHAKKGDAKKQAQAGLSAGRAYYMKNNFNKCFEVSNDAQAALREAGDRWGQAQALHMTAKVHSARKEHEQSLRLAQRAARLFKESGDGTSEARALLTACTEGVLVCAAGHRGAVASKNFNDQMEASLRQSTHARDAALKVGEERLYASALRICAQVTFFNGKAVEASSLAQEAASIARSFKDDKSEGTAKIIQAEALISISKFPKAMQACEEALILFRKVGDASGEGTALYLMGTIDAETAEFDMVKRGEGGAQAAIAAPAAEDSQAENQVAMPDKEKFLATLPLPERIGFQIKDLIGGITGRSAELDNDQTVMEAGLTSISAIMLRDQLNDHFPDAEGMEMTFVFEYPTVRSMTDFILEAMEDAA